MKSNAKNVGAGLIRQVMKATGLKMKPLAAKAGISASTLSRDLNEDAKAVASTQTLVAVADATGRVLALLPRDQQPVDINREEDRAELRMAVAIAVQALANEPNAAARLPGAVDEIREWLADQRRSGFAVRSTEEGLIRMGTLARNLGRSAPGA